MPSSGARKKEVQRNFFLRKRLWLWEQKSRPCADCGGVFPPCVMDFDHRPGVDKKFTIAKSLSRKMHELEAEVAKCDVVCANCHRIRTYITRKAA